MDFDLIYETYFDRIFNKIRSMVSNTQDAEDIAQEVFVAVYKNLGKFNNKSSIYTWIYKITLSKVYDFFRKRKKEFNLDYEFIDVSYEQSDNNILLKERLSVIKEEERKIVLLHNIYGYKFREIGKYLNIQLSTVKSKYYKSIKDMEMI